MGLAHQLNNPLSSIQTDVGSLEQMYEAIMERLREEIDGDESIIGSMELDEVDQRFRRCLQGIGQAQTRMKSLMNTVEELAEAPTRELTELDPGQVMESALTMCQFMERDPITFKLDVEDGIPSVEGDRMKLEQALVNVITNGVHATQDRLEDEDLAEAPIEVSVKQVDNEVVFKISDSGTGVPPDIVDELFQPFFTTKEQGEGFGIGLSQSRGIFRAHDGDLVFKGNADEGAVFEARLPVFQ